MLSLHNDQLFMFTFTSICNRLCIARTVLWQQLLLTLQPLFEMIQELYNQIGTLGNIACFCFNVKNIYCLLLDWKQIFDAILPFWNTEWTISLTLPPVSAYPDSKVHRANMGPTWGQRDPGGPHMGHSNLAIWISNLIQSYGIIQHPPDSSFTKQTINSPQGIHVL